jgi:hypothetical protein
VILGRKSNIFLAEQDTRSLFFCGWLSKGFKRTRSFGSAQICPPCFLRSWLLNLSICSLIAAARLMMQVTRAAFQAIASLNEQATDPKSHTLVKNSLQDSFTSCYLPNSDGRPLWSVWPKYAVKDPKAIETQIFGPFGNHDQPFRSDCRAYLWKCKSETRHNLSP